ncbi:MAG: phage tail spike protein [Bacillota bacterium]|nr:phage tail spike protein [Bacillota bacterium]
MLYFFDASETFLGLTPAASVREAIMTETINGAGTLRVTVDTIDPASCYVAHRDPVNPDTFRLYKIHRKLISNGLYAFEAIESAYDDLKADGIIVDRRPENATVRNISDTLLDGSRWTTGVVDSTRLITTTFYYQTRLDCFKWLFSQGLEARFRVSISGTQITGRTVDWADQFGADRGKRFAHGTGLLDVINEDNRVDLVTALIGRGRGEEVGEAFGRRILFTDVVWSVANGDPVDKPAGQNYVEIPARTAVFGYPNGKPRMGVAEFIDLEDPEELLAATYAQLETISRPLVTYRAVVRDEGDTGLGDTVAIIRDDVGVRYKTRIYKRVVNLLRPTEVEIELGDRIESYAARRLRAIREEIVSTAEDTRLTALDQARALIAGIEKDYWGEDGYNYDLEAGNAYELPAGLYSFNAPIDESPTKMIYFGAGRLIISDSKNPDDTWKITTVLDGSGLGAGLVGAEQILAGSIDTDHINTTGIAAEKIRVSETLTLPDQIANTAASLQMVEGSLVTKVDRESYEAELLQIDNAIAGTASAADLADLVSAQASTQLTVDQWAVLVQQVQASTDNHSVTLSDVTKYMTFDDGFLTVGAFDSPLSIQVQNDRINFVDGGAVVAYITGQTLYINSATIVNSLQVGNHKMEKYGTDGRHTVFRWIGG